MWVAYRLPMTRSLVSSRCYLRRNRTGDQAFQERAKRAEARERQAVVQLEDEANERSASTRQDEDSGSGSQMDPTPTAHDGSVTVERQLQEKALVEGHLHESQAEIRVVGING
jgi:hypothetical protein